MNAMRRTIANVSLTLDGRITGPGGNDDMEWVIPHAFSDAIRESLVDTVSGADAVLVGRTNYDGFRSVWPAVAEDPDADDRDRAFSTWLNGVRKILFSHTDANADWTNTERRECSPVDVVRELRSEPGGDILILASISIIHELLEEGELDRLVVSLMPELVGGGRRFLDLGDVSRSRWRLTDHAVGDTGAISLCYDRVDC